MWEQVLLCCIIVTSAGWVVAYARSIWGAASFPLLDDLDDVRPDEWPSVSIIVPACNEAETIEPALRSLLELDYPALEIIAVNDRSDDDTGAIIDRIAAVDDRVRPLHIEQLPNGWLGKTHALECGVEVATGEWLLFTDADVHFSPDAMRRAVSVATGAALDHLTLVPYVHTAGLLGSALYETFGILMLLSTRLDKVADPDDDAYMGVGAFNLVRADTLDAGRGFEHIRMEIADDFGLAMLVNQADGRTGAAYAPDALDLEWYPSLGAMIRGLRKNAFAVMCRFSYLRAAALILIGLTFVLGPFAGIAFGLAQPEVAIWAWTSSGAAFGMLVCQSAFYHVTWDRRLLAQLLVPIGQLLTLWAIARSAGHYWRTGGVEWRGTRYELDELRENQKVQI